MRHTCAAAVILGVLLLAGTGAAQTSDLPPGEANVIDVDWLERDEGTTFWVTLYKDTEGREGEADWWQLEQLDGTVIARYDIASQPSPQFTTNDTFTVPEGVRYIVVRGHDSFYLYGGRAIVVDLGGGGTAQYDQGADEDDLSSPSSGSSDGEDPGGGGGVGGNGTDDDPLVPTDPEQFDETQENDTDGQLANETWTPPFDGERVPLLPVAAVGRVVVVAGIVAWWRRRDRS